MDDEGQWWTWDFTTGGLTEGAVNVMPTSWETGLLWKELSCLSGNMVSPLGCAPSWLCDLEQSTPLSGPQCPRWSKKVTAYVLLLLWMCFQIYLPLKGGASRQSWGGGTPHPAQAAGFLLQVTLRAWFPAYSTWDQHKCPSFFRPFWN